MKKTLKVKMPLEPAIAAMEFICEHVNTMFADPKYVIAAGMATDALRAQSENNPPLTLDELRGMDGEPVWTVFEPDADADRLTLWALVDVTDGDIELRNNLGGHSALQDSMTVDGNHVDIYRRKPEGGEQNV